MIRNSEAPGEMAAIRLEDVDQLLDDENRRDLQMAVANKQHFSDTANRCMLYGLVKRTIFKTLDCS